jgi:vacuolar-type H+-ATPase subunit E/Vma4
MALEDIIAHIKKDGNNRAEAALAEARQRAAEIAERGDEQAEAEAGQVRAGYAARAEAARRRILTLAHLEANRRLLEARQSAVDEAFERARRELQALPDRGYLELIERVVVENAVTGDEELVLNARDQSRLDGAFLEHLNAALRARGLLGQVAVAQRTAPICGGCVLAGRDIELNASFDVALKMARDDLESEVAAVLFGDGS